MRRTTIARTVSTWMAVGCVVGCAATTAGTRELRSSGKHDAPSASRVTLRGRVTYSDENGAPTSAAGVLVEYHDGRGGCAATATTVDGEFNFADKSVECAPPFALVPPPQAEEASFPPFLAVSLCQDPRLAVSGAPTVELARWESSRVGLHPIGPDQADGPQHLAVPPDMAPAVAFFVRALPVLNQHLTVGHEAYQLLRDQANGVDFTAGDWVLSAGLGAPHAARAGGGLDSMPVTAETLVQHEALQSFVQSLASVAPENLFSSASSECDDAVAGSELAQRCALETEILQTMVEFVPLGDVAWAAGDAALGDGDAATVGLAIGSYIAIPYKVVEKLKKLVDMVMLVWERTHLGARALSTYHGQGMPRGFISPQEAGSVVTDWATALLEDAPVDTFGFAHPQATMIVRADGEKPAWRFIQAAAATADSSQTGLPSWNALNRIVLDQPEIHWQGIALHARQQWRLAYGDGQEVAWQLTALLTRDLEGFPKILMARLEGPPPTQPAAAFP